MWLVKIEVLVLLANSVGPFENGVLREFCWFLERNVSPQKRVGTRTENNDDNKKKEMLLSQYKTAQTFVRDSKRRPSTLYTYHTKRPSCYKFTLLDRAASSLPNLGNPLWVVIWDDPRPIPVDQLYQIWL